MVLTRDEVSAILGALTGAKQIVAMLLSGSGLRLMEALTLRVKDVDFARAQLTIRSGKGDKDRATVLPAVLHDGLRTHLRPVRRLHERDIGRGAGYVALPGALERKYPTAARDWLWQWVFPATTTYREPVTGKRRRHHLHETAVQRAVRTAVLQAGVPKRATFHTFRHSFRRAFVGARCGHSYRSGAAWPLGLGDDNDLHACAAARGERSAESVGVAAREAGRRRAVAQGAGYGGVAGGS